MTKRSFMAVHVVLACVLLAGCSKNMNEDDLRVRSSDKVADETEKASSEILDLAGVKGKVTESGAFAMPCAGYSSEKVYRAHHPWSLYGLPFEELKKAFGRLRDGLPGHGWKIVKDGPDGSPSKAPQIIANHKGGDFSVDIRLHDESKRSGKTSLLEVTVESACFKKQAD
ncbi:hypothetical protein [Streptomyces niger]|uniref:hypothetical protein n=1 Tax=Streptomyces niger TaxID=66373 RepID=UPI001F29E535|nr:hypothetical protein [Streptomyces niger]